MNREEISRIAHADHPIKAPLGDDSVRALLAKGLPRGDERVLDLGCGTGEWLLRALETGTGVHAEGVDVSPEALAEADEAATRRGLRQRLVLHDQDAAKFTSPQPFDLVLSVGAAHAFGGLLPTLAAAREHLAPGGSVLVGDGFWDGTPSAEAVGMLGDFDDLATTVDRVVADGWTPVHGHVSTRRELDDYEWACWGGLAGWALDHGDDPQAPEVLATAGTRRTEWLHTYRDTFGFLTLVLRRTPDRS
ncbi:class I SAM-dependent methyltransferase [Streptomyces cocklensis]|uniref:Methyltransferase domain-containing protein n=1 Tax=Actinacidiphila cocklensis TaxID=887465 RepID=A0A9W4GRH5_9ACTN|nr:class I SAM-dependent methyltransferase [Actinacidiphila cocklensis]MDD1063296.1 class I SAM-dependent methyltransferase [Actinacidiphila cocklensis]WSX74463.1 class I SAM-dependent methyltransferase [Streptomyces sp. NBC_00899]CAG6393738.1 Methyltransferase domain-containing protein [Actinacidiphila cocklensis]